MIALIIMNHSRPENVKRIVENLPSEIKPYIIDITGTYEGPGFRFTCTWDPGLYVRFYTALAVTARRYIIQDDDLQLSHDGYWELLAASMQNSVPIHGIFGRRPKPNGAYAINVKGDEHCPVILTRVLVCTKNHLRAFVAHEHQWEDIMSNMEIKPRGNGEDIIFSYSAILETGIQNQVHNILTCELPAANAIHARWRKHWEHRSLVMRRGERLCKERWPSAVLGTDQNS